MPPAHVRVARLGGAAAPALPSDLDFVVDYALRLASALTAARVGFFHEQHKDELLVDDRHLEALHAHVPAQPRYFDRRHRKGGPRGGTGSFRTESSRARGEK